MKGEGFYTEELPGGTFKESGTEIRTMLIVLCKSKFAEEHERTARVARQFIAGGRSAILPNQPATVPAPAPPPPPVKVKPGVEYTPYLL